MSRTAQEHADTLRNDLRRAKERLFPGTWEKYRCRVSVDGKALDALLAEVERLTNVLEYTQMRADAQQERAEAAERERDWLREQLDRQTENAAVFLRERDNAKDALERMRQELVRVDGLNRAAEALAERRGDAMRNLLNEVDCRIEHGAESGGHLDYVWDFLRAALAEDASHQDAGEPGYGGDGDGAAT